MRGSLITECFCLYFILLDNLVELMLVFYLVIYIVESVMYSYSSGANSLLPQDDKENTRQSSGSDFTPLSLKRADPFSAKRDSKTSRHS